MINRITLAGAVFLSIIALVPQVVSSSLSVDFFISSFLGGTGILIVVGVALDLVDKIEAQLLVFGNYRTALQNPREHAQRIREFLGLPLDVEAMAGAVDPSLYRNRR